MTLCVRRSAWVVIVAAATAALSPTSSLSAGGVREYLDETTAATVAVGSETLVFARERTELAVNARDYISLVPVEINRSGVRACYWFAYVWSTIDRRGNDDPLVSTNDELILMADGRPIRLVREARTLRELGIARLPSRSPARSALPLLFPADVEIVSHVGGATDLSVHLVRGEGDEVFELWADAREALRQFVDHVSQR